MIKDFDSENNWKFEVKDVLERHKIYLIDYGLAIKEGCEKHNELKAKVCGTAGYMPPELLNTRNENARTKLNQEKFDTFA